MLVDLIRMTQLFCKQEGGATRSCGDVMNFKLKSPTVQIFFFGDAKVQNLWCGSANGFSSLYTEWLR